MRGKPNRSEMLKRPRTQPQRGFTYIELLVACAILVIAASGVIASLRILPGVPRNKRITEMGVYIGTQELERLKVRTYELLAKNTSGWDWYDKYGAWISSGGATPPAAALYKANWSVPATSAVTHAGGVDRNGAVDSEDLIELVVTVWDPLQTAPNPYETARTLVTFGVE